MKAIRRGSPHDDGRDEDLITEDIIALTPNTIVIINQLLTK
jgi:hypothetical protein